MPIDKSEWSLGKCSYKMLLYAASGIPTITSSFGMNGDLIDKFQIGLAADSPIDWYDHLEYCYNNRDRCGISFQIVARLCVIIILILLFRRKS